ncbi:putative amino acid transporter, transmembrane domain-containing protein [Helianthus anomalus]
MSSHSHPPPFFFSLSLSLTRRRCLHTSHGDGFHRRFHFSGTLLTASAHVMGVVIGSGVLSLAWCLAELGWILGVLLLAAFAFITWFCISDFSMYLLQYLVMFAGTLLTATPHVMAVVIGSGVLSLAWSFAVITWYTYILLSYCYRSPDLVTGTRNYNYVQAVKVNLGGFKYKLCGISQYVTLVGTTIGYTITSAISLAEVKRLNCFHKYGHKNDIEQPY